MIRHALLPPKNIIYRSLVLGLAETVEYFVVVRKCQKRHYMTNVYNLSDYIHSKKRTTCSGLMKTALNNVLLPTLFKVVNNIVQHCYT